MNELLRKSSLSTVNNTMEVKLFFNLLLIAMLTVDVHSQPNEMPEALKDRIEYSRECSINLGFAVMQDIETILYKDEKFLKAGDSLNRLSGCIHKKMGIVNDNSDIDREALERYISAIATINGKTSPESRKAVSNIATECSEVKGRDYGQTAVKIENCIRRVAVRENLFDGEGLIL